MEYEKLLDKAIDEMPESVQVKSRFEIPKVRGHLEGNKTIISNFQEVVGVLRRPAEHVLKYLLKEIAAPGVYKNGRLIIGSKQSAGKINEKIRKYAEEFVLCRQCGKPDTKMDKEGSQMFIKCPVCSARYPIKSTI